jgi:hypothetical protein
MATQPAQSELPELWSLTVPLNVLGPSWTSRLAPFTLGFIRLLCRFVG